MIAVTNAIQLRSGHLNMRSKKPFPLEEKQFGDSFGITSSERYQVRGSTSYTQGLSSSPEFFRK